MDDRGRVEEITYLQPIRRMNRVLIFLSFNFGTFFFIFPLVRKWWEIIMSYIRFEVSERKYTLCLVRTNTSKSKKPPEAESLVLDWSLPRAERHLVIKVSLPEVPLCLTQITHIFEEFLKIDVSIFFNRFLSKLHQDQSAICGIQINRFYWV